MAMQRVLVTGASGFIALHCIKQLLDAGYHVRGTLRNMARQNEVRDAVGVKSTTRRVSFIACDLKLDHKWNQAMEGCDYVLHVASPFPPTIPKHEDDLIIPARDGALRVLEAAKKAGIKRVVMTSSLAAIAGGHDRRVTEADWTDINHPSVGAYEKSKTIAEQAAWDFSKTKAAPELAVINPGAVLGPLLGPDYSASGDIVRLLMSKAMPACPRVGFAMVDVRDVAAAHIAAMTVPDAAGKRFLCCLDHIWMQDVAKILDAHYGEKGWDIPTKQLSSLVVRLGSLFNPTLKRIKPRLGRTLHVDNTQIREVLNWQPRSNEEMVVAMAESMIAHGVITKPS